MNITLKEYKKIIELTELDKENDELIRNIEKMIKEKGENHILSPEELINFTVMDIRMSTKKKEDHNFQNIENSKKVKAICLSKSKNTETNDYKKVECINCGSKCIVDTTEKEKHILQHNVVLCSDCMKKMNICSSTDCICTNSCKTNCTKTTTIKSETQLLKINSTDIYITYFNNKTILIASYETLTDDERKIVMNTICKYIIKTKCFDYKKVLFHDSYGVGELEHIEVERRRG